MQQGLSAKMVILRAINYFVDRIFALIFAIIALLTYTFLINNNFSYNDSPETILFVYSVIAIIFFLYYFIGELFMGRTLAKFLTQTQVIGEDNTKIGPKAAFLRTICRLIPLNEFSMFIVKGRTFHDAISRTVVVPTKDLPTEMRFPRLANIIVTALVIVLLLSPLALLYGYIAYEQLTGGERISVPNKLPANMRLISASNKTFKDNDYQELVYVRDGKRIVMTWQIAGYDFDSDQDCSYIIPTQHSGFSELKIDEKYVCNMAASRKQDGHKGGWYEAYRTEPYTITGVTTDQLIADYYLGDPPNRLVIKAEKGALTEQDVIDMYSSGHTGKTIKKLKSEAGL